MRTSDDSQCAAILGRLRKDPGQWVSMPDLVHASGSFNVHTRVDEIRHRLGETVECKIERAGDSRRQFSFYRIPPPPSESSAPSA